MICCKIIAEYGNPDGNFAELMEKLVQRGDVLWEGDELFFGDYSGSTDEKNIKNILKKSGYIKSYIDIYDQNNPPHENDNINGWILDKIIKINYKKCEEESQKVFRDISIGLDMLDKEIEDLAKQNKINQEGESDGLEKKSSEETWPPQKELG